MKHAPSVLGRRTCFEVGTSPTLPAPRASEWQNRFALCLLGIVARLHPGAGASKGISVLRILHFNVTRHPTAEWTAQQMLEAFRFDTAPRYLLRDRDGIYGFIARGFISRWREISPESRPAQSIGRIVASPEVGGLHHERVA